VQKNLTVGRTQRNLDKAMAETTLGKELRRLRAGRSLRDVAADVGISHSLLGQIENDGVDLPRRETMDALAHYYGVPLEYLARLAYCGGRPLLPATA
jgi:transcriptional regulator with XRE-family HTH domain